MSLFHPDTPNSEIRRASVETTSDQAVESVESGMTIAIGGLSTSSRPMALIRALVRRGVRDLTVVGGAMAGLDVDLLIGAGLVRRLVAGTVGAGPLAGIGPWYRRAAESGQLHVWECDEASMYLALRAAALDVPFLPWRSGLGSSLLELNPDLKLFDDPHGSGPVIAVPAIQPDVALLHASCADQFGNIQPMGSGMSDDLMHRASLRTIVEVERIVPSHVIRQHPERTTITDADAVVWAPYGAHPFASPGHYLVDTEYLLDYVSTARAGIDDKSVWDDWLTREVLSHSDHLAYLEHIGIRRLVKLHEH